MDTAPSYPASYTADNVIAVAATDNRDQAASFTNYGRTTVHVAAPGVSILSTIRNAEYHAHNGTSMACPHVAGIAALMKSVNPGLSPSEVKDLLIRSSDKVSSLRRTTISKGRVNAHNAVHAVFPPSDHDPDESQWMDYDASFESLHPYHNSTDESFSVTVPGARFIRAYVERLELEPRYDFLTVMDDAGNVIERLNGTMANYATDHAAGNTLKFRFTSDNTITAWGYRISKIQVVY
jgi:thermitase